MDMALSVLISREQAEKLIDDPETELVIYYPDGTTIVVRITEEQLGTSRTLH